MKTLSTAFFLLALLSTTGLAQAAPSQNAPKLFGSASCNANFTCPNEAERENPEKFAPMANQCVMMYFGLAPNKPHFEPSDGLDYNGCFSSAPVDKDKSTGVSMTPHCCIVPIENTEDRCTIKCELHAVR